MKLSHSDIKKHIEIKENSINLIVIENQTFLSKFIFDLLQQMESNEGAFTLSQELKIFKLADKVEFILDPFRLEFNQRKISLKILEIVKKTVVNEENYMKTKEIEGLLLEYLEGIIEKIDIPISISPEIDFGLLFKNVSMKIENEKVSFLSQLVDYIKLIQGLLGINIFIFLNLKSFLTEEELCALYKEVNYCKIDLILVESREHPILEFEEILIVDNDLCEIYCDRQEDCSVLD